MGPWDYLKPDYKVQHNNHTVVLHISYLLKQLVSAILLYIKKNNCFNSHAIPYNAKIDDDKQVHWTAVQQLFSSETANELFAQLQSFSGSRSKLKDKVDGVDLVDEVDGMDLVVWFQYSRKSFPNNVAPS